VIDTNGQHSPFYKHVLLTLRQAGVPFLVGGAFALDFALGTNRRTKDLDLLVTPERAVDALTTLEREGYRTEMTDETWLGKAFNGDDFVDVIFRFGNGLTAIDDSWFDHALPGELWGVPVAFCGAEESLWSKAFIMERDRFDGADVAHIIRLRGHELDWPRIVQRFGAHWRVLLAHLVLFGYIYPGERAKVPRRVLVDLLDRVGADHVASEDVCFGPYLSRSQYVYDLDTLGSSDARASHPTAGVPHRSRRSPFA